MSNVRNEQELYAPMCVWLKSYMEGRFKRQGCKIIVEDTHSIMLDKALEQRDIIQYYPQAVGLRIEIDVLGMAIWDTRAAIIFIEAKKTELTLRDLGQLWAYCRLCDPMEAFLLSSKGLGALGHVLEDYMREDLLDFGDGRTIKKMHVGLWDVDRNTIDNHSIIPKI